MEKATQKLVLSVYNMDGQVVSEREVSPAVFGVAVNPNIVHFASVVQQANKRTVLASTKGRGEVRGGGKKPWRQKGTGRARHGSIRSPLWKGGGVVFGPRTERNYSMKINKKVKRQALTMVLSERFSEGRVVLVDDFAVPTAKTKQAFGILKKLPLPDFEKGKKVGIITAPHSTAVSRSLRNMPTVRLLPVSSLNVYDLLHVPTVVIPLASVDVIEKQYASLPKA
ncbi:50S ribosomal protein L4 [Candidatus Uhrbacteria bacterium]|nr:50S ribosomal protein L4 [Candidatus Uhrbacteria bacterium]